MGARAVCLLSGGLDSAVAAALALQAGFDIYPLSINYNQRHARELESAEKLAAHWSAPLKRLIVAHPGGSALTGDMEVPLDRKIDESIPVTYVPGRNTIFTALAASYAEVIGAGVVYVGFNALDYSGYPDCRPEYVEAMNKVLAIGFKRSVEGEPITIAAPLVTMTKSEIIGVGKSLGVPFHLTWSCYSGGTEPCGRCDSCIIRAKGFAELELIDPALKAA